MRENTTNAYAFDSITILGFFYKWRKEILIVCAIAALAAAVFSGPFFIKPKFKSTVILYPATTNSISKALLNENSFDRDDPLAFGEEEEAEQLIQVLYSDDIRDEIIRKYDLMNHYDIDSTSKTKFTKLYKRFNDNISFRRTEYMSVEIQVLDTDPEMAAKIANDISNLLDARKNTIQREQALIGLRIVEAQFTAKKAFVNQLNDSLNFFRSQGVFDYDLQTDHLMEQFVSASAGKSDAEARLEIYRAADKNEKDTSIVNNSARLAGSKSTLLTIQKQLDKLSMYGGAYTSVKEQLEKENEELVKFRSRYEKAKIDAEESMPVKFIVNSAKVAEKKHTPVRWLIVVLSTVGAFLMSLLVLIAVENFRFLTAQKEA
jgi:capsular polysaccharide biosynthesis protein